jgi:hypothetical protein
LEDFGKFIKAEGKIDSNTITPRTNRETFDQILSEIMVSVRLLNLTYEDMLTNERQSRAMRDDFPLLIELIFMSEEPATGQKPETIYNPEIPFATLFKEAGKSDGISTYSDII